MLRFTKTRLPKHYISIYNGSMCIEFYNDISETSECRSDSYNSELRQLTGYRAKCSSDGYSSQIQQVKV